jgi:hypothetical protein
MKGECTVPGTSLYGIRQLSLNSEGKSWPLPWEQRGGYLRRIRSLIALNAAGAPRNPPYTARGNAIVRPATMNSATP